MNYPTLVTAMRSVAGTPATEADCAVREPRSAGKCGAGHYLTAENVRIYKVNGGKRWRWLCRQCSKLRKKDRRVNSDPYFAARREHSLILRCEGKTYQEIGDKLGLARSSAQFMVRRAAMELQRAMRKTRVRIESHD